jgi:hypothetical protein
LALLASGGFVKSGKQVGINPILNLLILLGGVLFGFSNCFTSSTNSGFKLILIEGNPSLNSESKEIVTIKF